MKQMKKMLALAVVFVLMAAGAAGCGQKNAAASSTDNTEEVKVSDQKTDDKQEEEKKTEEEEKTQEETKDTEKDGDKQTNSASGITTVEYTEDEVMVDENGTPLTKEEIEDINGGDPSVGMSVPFVEYTDYDIFLQDSQIEVEAPTNLPITAEYVSYLLYNDGMYEIQYEDEQENKVYFRKGKGTEDISGVYFKFDRKEIGEINGRDVIFGIVDGKYLLATWTDGSYAYSVYADPGYDLQTIADMVSSVKAAEK